MDDSAFIAELLDLIGVDFTFIGYVALVAEYDESDVGYGVLFDLLEPGGTSFSQ